MERLHQFSHESMRLIEQAEPYIKKCLHICNPRKSNSDSVVVFFCLMVTST